jgi:5'-nucleotidase
MKPDRKHILLTNDDGIDSPGLWAAAEALSELGYVTVAAPRNQFSGAGRSHPIQSDGVITPRQLQIGRQIWTAYAIGGSPAQAVLYAVYDLLTKKPDLVVSGINYGENLGTGITISGTLGAAFEAASVGVPALAVSLQLMDDGYLRHSRDVKFTVAAHFTALFAKKLLEKQLPQDVHVLKVDVPASATPDTPWRVTNLGMHRYFVPFSTRSGLLDVPGPLGYKIDVKPEDVSEDSDIHTLLFDNQVAVTALSLDMTSRLPLPDLDAHLRDDLNASNARYS